MKKIVVITFILLGLALLISKALLLSSEATAETMPVLSKPLPAAPQPAAALKAEEAPLPDEEPEALKAMKEQINKERGIQQQIKLHTLELERTRVQLEQEKALAEMNKLRRANVGILKEPLTGEDFSIPEIKLVFLLSTETNSEAIVSLNGTNYTVKQGDKPQSNVLVQSITSTAVTVVVNGKHEITLTPNLME